MDEGIAVYIGVIGVLLLFAVFSNVLVIVCVARFRKLRTVTNTLICNLAISDILLAGFFMPQKVHDISHTDDYHEGTVLCKLVNFFPIFVITNSCYTLVCVSFERRRAILEITKPQMTFTQLAKLLPVVWMSSLIISFPTMIEYNVETVTTRASSSNETETQQSCDNSQMPRMFVLVNGLVVVVSSFVIPVILMFHNYGKLAVFIYHRGVRVRDGSEAVQGRAAQTQVRDGSKAVQGWTARSQLQRHRIRLVKMLIIVAGIFAVSWLPFYVLYIYSKITGKDASHDADSFLALMIIALATCSTAYNVILYVIFNKNFKQAILLLLRCACTQNPLRTTAFTTHAQSKEKHAVQIGSLYPGRLISPRNDVDRTQTTRCSAQIITVAGCND